MDTETSPNRFFATSRPLLRRVQAVAPLAIVLTSVAISVSPSPVAAQIPANTWVELDPAPCGYIPASWEEVDPPDWCSSEIPEKRGYSGTALGGGYIYYFGGADNTWGGNDIDAYDIAESRWTQLTETETWDSLSEEPGYWMDPADWGEAGPSPGSSFGLVMLGLIALGARRARAARARGRRFRRRSRQGAAT